MATTGRNSNDSCTHRRPDRGNRGRKTYASDQLTREAYINRNIALDKELDQLKQKKTAIAEAQAPNGFEEVDDAIRQFCDRAATRLQRCTDFDSKRRFLLDHIEKIIYHRDKVTLIGCVPIELKEAQSITGSTLPFHVEGQIDRAMVRGLPKGQSKFDPEGQLVKSAQSPSGAGHATMGGDIDACRVLKVKRKSSARSEHYRF